MDLTALRLAFDKFMAVDLSAVTDALDATALSDAEKDAYINRALEVCGLSLYLYNRVAFAPTNGQGSYQFSDVASFTNVVMLSVDRVMLDGSWIRDYTRRVGLFTFDQFRSRFPSYTTAVAGVPVAATVVGRSLLFDKPFDASAASDAGYVWGRHMPRALVDGGYEEPVDVPSHLHETVAQIAAVRAAMMTFDAEQEQARLQTYAQDAYTLLVAEFKRSFIALHGRDPEVDELRESCSVYRHVEGKNLARQ